MQCEDASGSEGITSASRALNEFSRHIDASLGCRDSIAAHIESRTSRVKENPPPDAETQNIGSERQQAVSIIRLRHQATDKLRGLEFVEEQPIDPWKTRTNHRGKIPGMRTHQIRERHEPGLTRSFEDPRRPRASVTPDLIESVQKSKVTQKKKSRVGVIDANVMFTQKSVCAALVKESPSSALGYRHHIRVGRRMLFAHMKSRGGYSARRTVVENGTAIGIIPDEPHPLERKRATQLREIFEDIVGASAVSGGLGYDAHQRILRRPCLDDLYVVHDPVSRRQNPAAII